MQVKKYCAVLMWIAILLYHGSLIKADARKEVRAAQDIQGSGNYKLMKDIRLQKTWEIKSGETITIDLNGYELSSAVLVCDAFATSMIVNEGVLTIQDTSQKESGTLVSKALYAILNRGQLFIKGGTYQSDVIGKRIGGIKKISRILLNEKELTIIRGAFFSKSGTLQSTAGSNTMIHSGVFVSASSRRSRVDAERGYQVACIQNGGVLLLGHVIIQGNSGGLKTSTGHVYYLDDKRKGDSYPSGKNPIRSRENQASWGLPTRRMLRKRFALLDKWKGRILISTQIDFLESQSQP